MLRTALLLSIFFLSTLQSGPVFGFDTQAQKSFAQNHSKQSTAQLLPLSLIAELSAFQEDAETTDIESVSLSPLTSLGVRADYYSFREPVAHLFSALLARAPPVLI